MSLDIFSDLFDEPLLPRFGVVVFSSVAVTKNYSG